MGRPDGRRYRSYRARSRSRSHFLPRKGGERDRSGAAATVPSAVEPAQGQSPSAIDVSRFVTTESFDAAISSLRELITNQSAATVPNRPTSSRPSSAPLLSDNESLGLDYEDDAEDVVDIHPPEQELREFDESATSRTPNVSGPSAQPSGACAAWPPVESADFSQPPPKGTEQEPELWTFHDLIGKVYDLLPTNHCPPQPPPSLKVRSITEDLVGETLHQVPCLPHSSTVKATASLLGGLEGISCPKKPFTVPAATMRQLSVPGAYNVHSEQWPVKAPPLDTNASKVGIPAAPAVRTTWAYVEATENKLRTSVSMLSHADLFCAAAHRALSTEDDKDTALSLLGAVAKTIRHAMGTSMALSMEYLLLRRDAAIQASNVLPGENRDRLRAAPISSDKLLGGLCASVASDDAAQRQRDRLVRPQQASNQPGPKGSSRPNPSKGKRPQSRVPPMGARKATPMQEEPSYSKSSYRGGKGRKATSSRGRFFRQGLEEECPLMGRGRLTCSPCLRFPYRIAR